MKLPLGLSLKSITAIALNALLTGSLMNTASALTYTDLVSRLTDMEQLSVLPADGEKCAQWSSYERTSKYDSATNTYVNWDANTADGKGIIRTENGKSVLAEMQGPGCIWRIWSAAPSSGHVYVYLDGSTTPVVDLSFTGYFDRTQTPFIYPALVNTTANGKNCYVPIPYQKSCKIVADSGWGEFYHFTYSTFPEGTTVSVFHRDLSQAEMDALSSKDSFLTNNLGQDPAGERTNQQTISSNKSVDPHSSAVIAQIDGEKAITYMRFKLASSFTGGIVTALRSMALKISWDGETNPSVWVPIGDFFGNAPGIAKYKSLPAGMDDDGFYSLWYMPFASGAKVELINDGDVSFPVSYEIKYAPLTKPINTLGRFHAKWHRDAFLPTEAGRSIDWPMLKTTGRGRYCGVTLCVWNERSGWWGEGDEKFFVDSEKFPSTFGTGSEDYFGYAWCSTDLFQNAYHNQTRVGAPYGDWTGSISCNRWHITDNVPFTTSFEGCIEKYFTNDTTKYACTAYWYLSPDGTDPYQPVSVSDRLDYFLPSSEYIVPGVLEAEDLTVVSVDAGTAKWQYLKPQNGTFWSSNAQVWWSNAGIGNKININVPVSETGDYQISMRFTKASDYGIFKFSMNGSPIGSPVDLYSSALGTSDELKFSTVHLKAGDNILTAVITGKNALSTSYMFGLDYIRLSQVSSSTKPINNMTMNRLMRVWGKVSNIAEDGSFFYLDDGSNMSDGTQYSGIRIDLSNTYVSIPTGLQKGSFVAATGLSKKSADGTILIPVIVPRKESDITIY